MRKGISFRTMTQLLSLAAFLLLLFAATYPLRSWVPYDLFLRLDPLTALGTASGSWSVPRGALLSLWLVALSLIAGRLFCGYLCPCGTMIDLSDRVFSGNRQVHREANSRYRGLRNLKFHFLLVLLLAGALGCGLLYAFDPISLLTRTFSLILYPLAILLWNALLGVLRPLAGMLGFVGMAHAHSSQPVFDGNVIVFLIFAGVLALVVFSRRFWCRYLCPLGALLGILSHTALIRRKVKEGCTGCGRCQEVCPMDAIRMDPAMTVQSECIGCRTCEKECPEEAISFTWRPGPRKAYRSEVALARRGFLYSVGGAASLAFLAHTSTASTRRRGLLRPPGALPEEWFNDTCIRCGECVRACVTNTLQPSLLEAGLDGLWTPRCMMRLAGCAPSCNVCGQVCPTRAIRALPLEEKRFARIGTAELMRQRCIAWEQDKLCLICDEACPFNAVVFRVEGGVKRPFVDELKCNGCGICEQACPVVGDAAIQVTPSGQIRLKEGSYRAVAHEVGMALQGREEIDQLGEISVPNEDAPVLPPGFIP